MSPTTGFLPLLLAATMLVIGTTRADVVGPSPNFDHDARLAYDLSSLESRAVEAKEEGNWAVFRVLSEAVSVAEYHKLTSAYRGAAPAVTPWPVTATPVDVLAGAVPAAPSSYMIERRNLGMLRAGPVYEWFYNGLSPSPRPSAFTAICRVTDGPAVAGRKVLADVVLIPEGWADQVKPALKQWRAERAAFADPKAAKTLERLRELARGENPVLAVLAYRSLADAGRLGLADFAEGDLRAIHPRGSTALFFLLRHSSADEAAKLADELGRVVDAAKSPRDLYGLAVACALELDTTPEVKGSRASFHLSKRIAARAAKLQDDGGKPDEYLTQALRPLRGAEHTMEFKARRARERARPDE